MWKGIAWKRQRSHAPAGGATRLRSYLHCLELAAEVDEGGVGAQRGHGHLQQQHAHAVHVEAVRVVQLPQDGRQHRCYRRRGGSRSLHATSKAVK